ncbi:MAG: DUF4129 domain-containing protein [Dehalococcoidia bacterium]
MNTRLRLTAEVLFLVTEALAWFVAMRAFATVLERSALRDLAAKIDLIVAQSQARDLVAAEEAARIARSASESVVTGPPFWAILLAVFAAYFLSRGITRARIGALGPVLGIAVSFLALNALFHLVLAGDLRVWDSSGLARFLDRPDSPLRAPPDPLLFIADPDPANVEGRSYMALIAALLVMWVRFLVAGRSAYRFERSLRSFSLSFPVVLVAVIAASATSVSVGVPAVSYFVCGVLTLAIANAARTTDQGESLARRAPWAVSVLVTLGALAAVALVFSLLAALNAGAVLGLIGDGILKVISFLLVIVLTPIFWVVERLLGGLLGVADFSFLQRALDNARAVDPNAEREAGQWEVPTWIREALRIIALGLAAGGVWYLARLIFRRLDRSDERGYAEERATASGLGLGGLLRQILPSRPPREAMDGRWLDRHAVYRLYARAVGDASERQFAPRAGETPLEFAAVANRVLEAPPFVPIAAEFDRARYGGHFPSAEELEPLTAALIAWEAGSPITDEIRARPPRGEEAPEIRTEPDVEAPDTPASPFPPPY